MTSLLLIVAALGGLVLGLTFQAALDARVIKAERGKALDEVAAMCRQSALDNADDPELAAAYNVMASRVEVLRR